MSNEIIVETGTILESLNNKVDLDGGNYIGSGLETYINKNSKSGFNLFDTKITDHILEGKEAKGWALQGTYVTKDLYPDFYERCLEEYNDGLESNSQPWQQPVLSSDVTQANEGEIVCTASSFYQNENCFPYCALDGVKSGNNANYGRFVILNTKTGWWQVKFPYKLKITGLKYYAPYSSSAENLIATTGRFYTSSEKITPIGDEINATTNWQEIDVANIPTEGIITDTIYFDITNSGGYGGIGELEITAIKINTIVTNHNGHKFYPISLKPQIDEIYETYGIADFYGIDEENERIFLPRNKYFAIQGVAPVVGNGMTLGLTNGTVNYGLQYNSGGTIDYLYGQSFYGKPVGTLNATEHNQTGNFTMGITTDPEKSGIEAHLEPNESKYLYYCVGNTVINEAEIDAGGLVAQMELKANLALDNVSGVGTSLASGWAMPSDEYINLTLGASGSTYTAPANGWFWFLGSWANQDAYIALRAISTGYRVQTPSISIYGYHGLMLPIKKGDACLIGYTNAPSNVTFRFIYAEGEI